MICFTNSMYDGLSVRGSTFGQAIIMKSWFIALLSSLTAFSWMVSLQAGEVDRPNILFILADDVGREVLGCYGGQSYATPNLDRLAASGARFNHCYSMPVCHPTRITLLSGQYPRHLNHPKWGTYPQAAEGKTFANIANRAGYATAVAGKWQLCMMAEKLMHPQMLGFDQWCLFGWHEGPRYHHPMVYENGHLRTDTEGEYGPNLYVEFLANFIDRSVHEGKPFLAFYSMALCHDVTNDLAKPVPYGPRGRYDNFSEMVEEMDQQIGKLMNHLKQSQLDQNTLIIFTSDNGTAAKSKLKAINNKDEFRYEQVRSEFEGQYVRGGKGTLTDWGTRVPMIAVWKDKIQPGQEWNDLVDFSDFLPTITDLTGGESPKAFVSDGHSLAPLLRTGERTTRKWAYSEMRGRFFLKTEKSKLYNTGEFFHTDDDPYERSPLDPTKLSGELSSDFELLQAAMRKQK